MSVAAGAMVAGGLVAIAPAASALTGVSPVLQRSASGVTADALPTVQIDGVVWSQVVVGNTVFAGGSFANARPAGAAPGTSQTARKNLLSFNLTTGALITTFAPSLNAQVKTVAASPDGSRIYVGGSFTQANGVNRYRIAAYSTSTGQLITSFAPSLNATVNSITVSATTVYVGGVFTVANGVARSRLAAFDPSNGALLACAPSADATVQAVLITPSGSRVIVGGQFQYVNGASAYGLASVSSSTGTLYPWAANKVVRDAGSGASILSLSTDGSAVYSTAYVYTSTGNFEGVLFRRTLRPVLATATSPASRARRSSPGCPTSTSVATRGRTRLPGRSPVTASTSSKAASSRR